LKERGWYLGPGRILRGGSVYYLSGNFRFDKLVIYYVSGKKIIPPLKFLGGKGKNKLKLFFAPMQSQVKWV
jgi:hypothetical protein